jgi:DNA repair exonuclease SbcCD ATPase subunit
MPNPPNDPIPPSLSMIRRRLISAIPAPDKGATHADDLKSETIDFESVNSEGVLNGLDEPARPQLTPTGYDDVEAMLARYQAEKGLAPVESKPAPATNGSRRLASSTEKRLTDAGKGHTGRADQSRSLPPLTNQPRSELERLKTENAELRQLNAEYRELLEANDPTVWEQKVADAEQKLAENEAQLNEMRTRVEAWDEKFKTHRFVPHDEESAQMADELDKERAKLALDRKQLEKEREQLKEDEDSLMNQMRDMEVSMAKDRAELARQRTELQRLQTEIKHELELMQRGDAGVKERLAQFQRRYQDALVRPAQPQAAPAPPPPVQQAAPPAPSASPRPRDSTVFKRLFGQG